MTGAIFKKNLSIEGQINRHQSWEKQQIDLAGFLDSINFTHFCTFTTSKPISVGSARRIAEKVHRATGGPGDSSMFWAAERFEVREGFHFHALLRCSMRPVDIFNWYYPRFGRCQIIDNSLPERMLPATYYVSKYIVKEISDYDIYISKNHLNIQL